MRSNRTAIFGIVFLILAVAVGGAILWLSNAPVAPPVKTINQVLPDDRIPR